MMITLKSQNLKSITKCMNVWEEKEIGIVSAFSKISHCKALVSGHNLSPVEGTKHKDLHQHLVSVIPNLLCRRSDAPRPSSVLLICTKKKKKMEKEYFH